MNKLLETWRAIEARKDLWFDLIRIYIGIALFVRGILFFTHAGQDVLQGFLDRMAFAEWGVTVLLAHYIVLAHLAGGFLLIVGLLTRIAAAVQVPILLGAVFFVHFQDGLFALGQALELSALVLFLLIMIFLHGPGRLSMDLYLGEGVSGRREQSPQASEGKSEAL